MLGDGKWNSGDQGSYFKYQYGVLKLLEAINAGIAALPGVDYETRTTNFEVIAGPTPPGVGYSIGDFLVRYDIVDVATGTVVQTIWFNQTLQTTLVGAGNPNPADLTPVSASLSVTVLNPFNLEATQLLIHALLTTIDGDTSNLDVLLSTRASEATVSSILTQLDVALSTRASETTVSSILTQLDVALSTRNAEATQLLIHGLLTTIDADTSNLDVLLSTRASEATLSSVDTNTATIAGDTTSLDAKIPSQGAAVTAASLPVNIASDQTVPVSAVSLPLPTGAATEAKQDTGNASLSTIATEVTSIDDKLNSLGQKTMAGSVPVVIASDQSTVPVSLPSGAQTISSSNVTDSLASPVAAGATTVSFRTDPSFTGSINGVTRLASTLYVFESTPGKTLPAIAYTVTAGSMDIDTIV